MQKKYGFVYIWFDKYRKMYYIGCHWGTVDDGYVCSSNRMRKAYRRRPNDFKRRLLKVNIEDKEKMFQEEYRYFLMIKEEELGKKYYNLRKHLWGHWIVDDNYKKTISERISQKTKEAMQRPEVREKYLEGLKKRNNRSNDPEVLEKRKQSMIKTMAEKFPVEKRYNPPEFNSLEYKENMAKSVSKSWESRDKEKIGKKISESLKNSSKVRSEYMSKTKWWNNGIINTRNIECPGPDWIKGKLIRNI